jgi:hypothetical protein
MSSSEDARSLKPPPSVAELPTAMSRSRAGSHLTTIASPSPNSPAELAKQSFASLSISTASQSSSRSASPIRDGKAATSGNSRNASISNGASPPTSSIQTSGDILKLIGRAFLPRVAVHASEDTEELIREKGFKGGFRELLRPFGDKIEGRVTIRDSNGAGRGFEDFGVRFVSLGDPLDFADFATRKPTEKPSMESYGTSDEPSRVGGDLNAIEVLVQHVLSAEQDLTTSNRLDETRGSNVPPFDLYLKRLLSGFPLSPHETFAHPVASVITISSRCENPIEMLRQLYDEEMHGRKTPPSWVNNDFLRYYVLVHDEDNGDVSKSLALFEQMKRNFGLNCHLLRLRSSQCFPSDDDSFHLPTSDWISAAEEIRSINIKGSYRYSLD